MREKYFYTLTLTFRPQICPLSYCCPASAVFTKLEASMASLIIEKIGRTRRTDKPTDVDRWDATLNAALGRAAQKYNFRLLAKHKTPVKHTLTTKAFTDLEPVLN